MNTVSVKDIKVLGSRRAINPDKVNGLVESIQNIGLINPISVTPDNVLIAGAHRLEAFKLLGIDEIPAVIMDLNGIMLELAEIDENFVRNDLTELQISMYLQRRKEIYEELHPSTVKGGDHTSDAGKQKADPALSFVKDTALQTGKSESSIKQSVKIGKNLSKSTVEKIKDTPIADNKEELKALANVPKQQQAKVVAKVLTGKAESIREAVNPKPRVSTIQDEPRPFKTALEAQGHSFDPITPSVSPAAPVDPAKQKRERMEALAVELLSFYSPAIQTMVTDIMREHPSYKVKDVFYFGVQSLAEKKK